MNTKLASAALALASVMTFAAPAVAAGDTEAGRNLPEICKSSDMGSMAMGHADMDKNGMAIGGMDQAHQDMMQGMAEMNANMDEGMMAKDIDVAFVCGMIPHHQGAIDMARAELTHGDDPWAKEMAQKVIDAQTQEIADMLDWLKKQEK